MTETYRLTEHSVTQSHNYFGKLDVHRGGAFLIQPNPLLRHGQIDVPAVALAEQSPHHISLGMLCMTKPDDMIIIEETNTDRYPHINDALKNMQQLYHAVQISVARRYQLVSSVPQYLYAQNEKLSVIPSAFNNETIAAITQSSGLQKALLNQTQLNRDMLNPLGDHNHTHTQDAQATGIIYDRGYRIFQYSTAKKISTGTAQYWGEDDPSFENQDIQNAAGSMLSSLYHSGVRGPFQVTMRDMRVSKTPQYHMTDIAMGIYPPSALFRLRAGLVNGSRVTKIAHQGPISDSESIEALMTHLHDNLDPNIAPIIADINMHNNTFFLALVGNQYVSQNALLASMDMINTAHIQSKQAYAA